MSASLELFFSCMFLVYFAIKLYICSASELNSEAQAVEFNSYAIRSEFNSDFFYVENCQKGLYVWAYSHS